MLAMASLMLLTQASRHGKWTYYWICFESDESGSGPKNTQLKTCSGKTIATVTRHYAERVRMEGTGKLNDGKVINLGDCDCGDGFECFVQIDENKYPWGIGSNDNPIYPYTSVASNDVKVGTHLLVHQIQGVELPGTGGQKHNGCVSVDDKGWSFGSNHLDFFVAKEKYYNELDNILKITSIDYEESDCTPLNYNFSAHKSQQETHQHNKNEAEEEIEFLQ
ncbi:3d domain protein [Stylonychia lemnae]|uniref:3d domain protein n=1 Tax=Stylonychia lemnae TaxID=5949 RepID=A0A078AFJ0_STYLE|nr:3d domain protein [Stylonychia lemnae]|eukprot:CDW79688.1 3d domain protein [Stylonychia lemnae]